MIDRLTPSSPRSPLGNPNIMYAIGEIVPDRYLIKLGTMGEYGTLNIDIEEATSRSSTRSHGYASVRSSPAPSTISKVHDSHNIHFACKIWGLRATDPEPGRCSSRRRRQLRPRAHQPLRLRRHLRHCVELLLRPGCERERHNGSTAAAARRGFIDIRHGALHRLARTRLRGASSGSSISLPSSGRYFQLG